MKELLGFIVGFVLVFVTCAMSQASFDLSTWSDTAREFGAICAFVVGAFLAWIVAMEKKT